MKIVYLSDDFPPKSFGGAGIIAYNIAKAMLAKGHDVSVITITDKKSEEGKEEYEGIIIYKLYSLYHERWRAFVSLCNYPIVKKVDKILSEIKPDIVHSHNVHSHLSYCSLKSAKKYSKGVFLTTHDALSFAYGKIADDEGHHISLSGNISNYRFRYNPFRNILIRRYLKYVDRIFVVSDALRTALNDNGIENTETIHNGINLKNWETDKAKIEDFRKKYDLKNKKVILFGGRLSGAKGGEVVVRAMAEVIKKNNSVVLMIVGQKNDFAEKMLLLAKELGFEKNIIFTGWIQRDDIKYAYAVSDVVVVASLYLDPFPTINLEAMACGKPVIGTIFGGTKEIVLDGVTGYTIDPNDTVKMSYKILDLLSDEKKAEIFGESGYKRVKNNFSEDIQIEKILSWYNKFLNK